MKALVLYCHPSPTSFTAAVCDVVLQKLQAAGAEIRHRDLYAEGFDPTLAPAEWSDYEDCSRNTVPVSQYVDDVRWCDTLIFVYPTWWYGLPAMLKGWMDRVLLPGVAFHLSKEGIAPGLGHIQRLGVFTTCGASRWLTWYIGAPGRRLLVRGARLLCARNCKTTFAAHYRMDASTPTSRSRHLARVERLMERFVGPAKPVRELAA